MKLKRVLFVQSVEAPGRNDRVAYLQSTDPVRKDSYAPDLVLSPLGVQAGDEIYPMHLVRRITVDADAVERDTVEVAPQREAFVGALEAAPRRRGRPPKSSAGEA